ncbi:MAG: VCBS repeat-containing protein [Myxococcaceae bacterium]|nr:VCBS repeat-containing protein [Myxococcaceae bacterium]
MRRRLSLEAIAGATGPLGPRALRVKDVTGDGRPDLLVVLKELERLLIIAQAADGGFGAVESLGTGSTPNDVAAADLDGDGREELLVVGHFTDALRVWRGLDGGWGAPVDYPLGNHCQRLELVDLDGDGRLDVVTQNGGSAGFFTVTFLLGRGDGSFGPAVASTVGDTPADLIVRSRGTDGHPEVLIATANSAQLERRSFLRDAGLVRLPSFDLPARPLRVVFTNHRAGPGVFVATHGFESPAFVSVTTPSDGGLRLEDRLEVDDAFEAVVADLSADGWAELIVTSLAGEVRVFDGLPDGGAWRASRLLADGGWPTSLVADDLDGDGHLDLAWTSFDGQLELAFGAHRCGRE